MDGNINFPVLGKVKAAGLTTVELSEKLTEQISEFILDPIVIINVLNFKVSILGGVNSPGTYSVQGERRTLTEAISLAGDLSVFGKRDNILVLRESNGKKDYAYLDIRDVNIMESEYYYLQQNDVIYVEPNNVVVQQSGINPIVPYIIAIVSFITTIVVVFIK